MVKWEQLHELLQRQLREHLGLTEHVPEPLRPFVAAVDASYKAMAPAPVASEPMNLELQTASGSPPRLLLAEDNPTNRTLAERMLQKLGCQVDLAANGLEAVAAAGEAAYDLILMDCQMPEMDGYEATRRIRAGEAQGRRVPVIAITAYSMDDVRQRCLDSGMDDYLGKPFRLSELHEVLRRWLRGCQTPARGT